MSTQLHPRRRVIGILLAVIAALGALITAALLRPSGSTQPPTAYSTTSAIGDPRNRSIDIPGVDFARDRKMILLDAVHAWAYVDGCTDYPAVQACPVALAYSDDAARSWHRVNLPAEVNNVQFDNASDAVNRWLPLDRNTVSLVTEGRLYLSKDRGKTWSASTVANPPYETVRAANLIDNFGTNLGDYQFTCQRWPVLWVPKAARAGGCADPALTKLGAGPVDTQPPHLGIAQQGGDGRIWIAGAPQADGRQKVAISSDGAKTWRELPPVGLGELVLSPDGSKAVIAHHNTQWRLVDDQWVELPRLTTATDGYPGQLEDLVVMNDGTIAAVLAGKGFYLVGDKLQEIPGLSNVENVTQRPDGTIIFERWSHASTQHVGVGTGMNRSWFTINVMTEAEAACRGEGSSCKT